MCCSKHGNCTMLSFYKMDTWKEIFDRYIHIFFFLLFFLHGCSTEPMDPMWPKAVNLHKQYFTISQLCSFLVISSPHKSVTQFSHKWNKLRNSTSWIWWNQCVQLGIILLLEVPQLSYHHGFPVWPHACIILARLQNKTQKNSSWKVVHGRLLII